MNLLEFKKFYSIRQNYDYVFIPVSSEQFTVNDGVVTIKEEQETHNVRLRWTILSDITYRGAELAIEQLEKVALKWNGEEVDTACTGWFTDKSIQTVLLGSLEQGKNTIEVTLPFGKRTNT